MDVTNVKVSLELDTGCSVTLMSQASFEALELDRRIPLLKPSTSQLRTYTGETLRLLGEVLVTVSYEDKVKLLPLVVISGTVPRLEGYD